MWAEFWLHNKSKHDSSLVIMHEWVSLASLTTFKYFLCIAGFLKCWQVSCLKKWRCLLKSLINKFHNIKKRMSCIFKICKLLAFHAVANGSKSQVGLNVFDTIPTQRKSTWIMAKRLFKNKLVRENFHLLKNDYIPADDN